MRRHIATLMWAALVGLAFTQEPGVVHAQGPPLLQTGTMLSFEGWEAQEPGCQQWEWYQQFIKVTGQVILPETQANVYHFAEFWGRDSGVAILRRSPRGDFLMYNGTQQVDPEIPFLITGPVGTSWEYWNDEEGHSIRQEIVAKGVSPFWLPEGALYDNLTRIHNYCVDCEDWPVLLESYWVNNDLGFLVGSLVWDAEPGCWKRSMWLVGVTRQHGAPDGG